jgi:hypothetical protein
MSDAYDKYKERKQEIAGELIARLLSRRADHLWHAHDFDLRTLRDAIDKELKARSDRRDWANLLADSSKKSAS